MKTLSAHSDTNTLAKESPDGNQLGSAIAQLIGNDLVHVNTMLDKQLGSPHPYMADVLNHAGQFRGKQIRPVLLLLCRKALGQETCPTSHTMATVVEMIHTATLVHDDIIDDASTRRHVGTVNSVWNSETSVLLGDYLFSRAFRLAASTGDAQACELIGNATDLTCAGELHQIAARVSRSRSERDYFRIVRGKTGQLFGLSLRLGARAAAADTRLQAQLQIAGIELGMAFQIADDILDLTGKEEQTGKDTGNDLFNTRLTLPLLRALQSASSPERSRIEALLETPNTESHMELCQHPDIHQGVSSSHATATRFVDSCLTRINYLPASRERDLLAAIARFAIQRQL